LTLDFAQNNFIFFLFFNKLKLRRLELKMKINKGPSLSDKKEKKIKKREKKK